MGSGSRNGCHCTMRSLSVRAVPCLMPVNADRSGGTARGPPSARCGSMPVPVSALHPFLRQRNPRRPDAVQSAMNEVKRNGSSAMPTTSNLYSAPGASLFIPPWPDPLRWIDAYARWTESWFDWQRALWQPVIDAQAEYLRQWQQNSGLPIWGLLAPMRGAEQLA